MPARMQFDLELGRRSGGEPTRRRTDGPMRLLVLGDFSAGAAGPRTELATRPTHRVDLDNVDEVMRSLAPALTLPLAGGRAAELAFESIEDFHPDALYARVEIFDALRQARARPPASAGDLLGALLGAPAGAARAPAAKAPATGVDALIERVVAPHIVPDTTAQTASYLAAVDAAIAEQMRSLLHHPQFQALEAAWRGVHWLLSTLELDEQLQLHLFDVTRDELLADIVSAQGRLEQTGLHRALADRWRGVPGGESWSLLAGLYTFGASDTDIGLLAALGIVASQAGGPFIAGGDLALAGQDAEALAGWNALRRSEAAPWIGLAAPRVLLRQPYGKRSDPVASFAFEEFVGPPAHEDFLWGHPSLGVALLVGRAFSARGWAMEPGDEREIGDLPAYAFERDGEQELVPCAEHHLGEQAGQALLAAGLMPLLSHRHRNAATFMRFQSIAHPAQPLAALGAP